MRTPLVQIREEHEMVIVTKKNQSWTKSRLDGSFPMANLFGL